MSEIPSLKSQKQKLGFDVKPTTYFIDLKYFTQNAF